MRGMRRLCCLALLLLTCPLATAAHPSTAQPPAALRQEIEARNRDLTTALERGDLLAVAGIYEDHAKIMGRNRMWEGRDEINRYWTRLAGIAKRWKLEVHEVGGSKDEPWQIGRSTLVTVRDGKEETSVVEFVVIWRRDAAGHLRIHMDVYN